MATVPRGPAVGLPGRETWAKVVARRAEWATQDGPDGMDSWQAYDDAWVGRLDDALTVVVDAVNGNSETDPADALIDVMAVASAWLDAMG
jgi:hypothetical protein